MRICHLNISLWMAALLTVSSCSLSKKQTGQEGKADGQSRAELVVLDPGHFHASLLQKGTLADVSDTVRVYAPEGSGVRQYLDNIASYNQRAEAPTQWQEQTYIGNDYLQKMLAEHQGNIVVLAGNNREKTHYIMESVKAGYNVLSDKPMAINKQDFNLLLDAYRLAEEKHLLLYDLMTERYDILNIIEKKLMHEKDLFGELQKGSPEHPSVMMESVHHFFKTVSGKPLTRPAWYYDVEQQGEGIADVTTHLIDLVNWQCFPEEAIRYQSDVKVTKAQHWTTPITLPEFSQSTQTDSFPPYLDKYIRNGILEVPANGSLNYAVKGINVGMKVIWNYAPPAGGGDTFTSVKKGSKATLKIVQDQESGFTKQLYIQQEANTDDKVFKAQLTKTIESLQNEYPFVSLQDKGKGLYLIDVPPANRLGHEEHFNKVARSFLHYLRQGDVPEWENENTLTKYYITTTAVELAKNEQ